MGNNGGGQRFRSNPGPQSVHINLNDLEDITCPACGSPFFYAGIFRLKKLGAIQNPKPGEGALKVETLACVYCGKFFQLAGAKLIELPYNPAKKEGDDVA